MAGGAEQTNIPRKSRQRPCLVARDPSTAGRSLLEAEWIGNWVTSPSRDERNLGLQGGGLAIRAEFGISWGSELLRETEAEALANGRQTLSIQTTPPRSHVDIAEGSHRSSP